MSPLLADKSIAVLCGGRSGEREVSLASAGTVMTALRDGGYQPRAVDTAEARWWEQLADTDIAFNIQHGRGGEDGVTQAVLRELGVICSGSGVLGSALSMDKLRSKQLWRATGLPTADFVRVDASSDFPGLLERWGRAFIKPACEGSSLGMTLVGDAQDFASAVQAAQAHGDVVLAEQFIDGPEYTVAILGDAALPAIRIEVDQGFYDYHAKYQSDATRYLVPCGLDAAAETRLGELARAAFAVLDCTVWGRVDLMRDGDGEFQLLEVNTVPGMTDHSLVPMAAAAAGISLPQLVERVLELSVEQSQREAQIHG